MGVILSGEPKIKHLETGLEIITNPVSSALVLLNTEVELAQLQKEQQIKEIKGELNDFVSNLIYTQKFKESDVSIQENLTGRFNLKTILFEKIRSYFYNVFSINTFQEKLNELEKLSGKTDFTSGSDEDNYIIQLRRIFRIQIPSIIKSSTNNILSDLKKNKIDFNKVTKITIKKGIITIILEDGKEVRSYKIDVSGDKKGFELKEPQIVNSDQRQEEKKEREEDLNLRHIAYPALGLTLIFTGAFAGEIGYEKDKKNQLKEVYFTDEGLRIHKIRLENEVQGENQQEFIHKAISQIEKQTGYKLNIDKSGKSFFESPESQNINISTMVEMVEKTFNFEDFKKKLEAERPSPGEKIDENELKKEFEKQKAESRAFLRGIELQEGPLVNPGRFVRKLLVQSPKVMNLQHWILYPIFFKEMQKKPGNLESYFKGAGEMATFNAGVITTNFLIKKILGKENIEKIINKSLKFLPGIPGTVARYLVQTGVSVIGGGAGISAGEYGAELMKLQQKFDELFPESEDFLSKNIKKITSWIVDKFNLNIDVDGLDLKVGDIDLDNYLSSVFSLGNKEIADFFKLDLSVPIFGRIWQHNLDLNTDKQEYLSGSMFRNRRFYNEMVDKMGDNIVDELEKLINKYNDPVSQGFGGPVRLTGIDRKILLEKRKITLLKNIEELIYSGDQETNKSIKDTVHNIITYNLDNVISGKTTILELKVLTQFELEKFKINDDFIEESERELDIKKYMFEITFGITKEPPDKITDQRGFINYHKAFQNIASGGRITVDFSLDSSQNIANNGDNYKNNFFIYLQSLTPQEQNFAKNYFYRTLNKEEVIQTEQRDTFSDSFNPDKTGYDIDFFSFVGQATKDAFKDDSRFVDGENSDEAIYERLIKNPLFHEYTLWVKEYKNNKDFIESMKN